MFENQPKALLTSSFMVHYTYSDIGFKIFLKEHQQVIDNWKKKSIHWNKSNTSTPCMCGSLHLFEHLCVAIASIYFTEPSEFKLTSAKSKLIAYKLPSCQHNYILLTWKVTIELNKTCKLKSFLIHFFPSVRVIIKRRNNRFYPRRHV